MICPHCSLSIKYRERSNKKCSKCGKALAFEPKSHSLRLTDIYFKKTVEKLGNKGTLYFTPEQLLFALSRKKMKSKVSIVGLIIFAVVTCLIGFFVYSPVLLAVVPFWIIWIFAATFYFNKYISLPITLTEFHREVLNSWKSTYRNYPPNLLLESLPPKEFPPVLEGILICEDNAALICLAANHTAEDLNLALISTPKAASEIIAKHGILPIYVLHDASLQGIGFLEKVKRYFSSKAKVIDLGLRPQAVIKSKLPKLREKNTQTNNFKDLTAEENNWLNEGWHTPLFVLKPEKLIQYVSRQIGRKTPKTANAENQAKAVGFMTWVGEK